MQKNKIKLRYLYLFPRIVLMNKKAPGTELATWIYNRVPLKKYIFNRVKRNRILHKLPLSSENKGF